MLEERILSKGQFREFKNEIASSRLSHAYLVLSEDALTRKAAANLTAELILCKEGGCGQCRICKKIAAGAHEDVKFYNENGNFKVKDAEALIEDTYLKGWESDTKLYFIDNAERLSPQVQNKLLKILEEPPKGVILFLLSGGENGILQTISSRTKKLYLPAFSTEEIFEELTSRGIERAVAETAAVFSAGRFDKAFKYSEEKGYSDIYDKCFLILKTCKKSSDIVRFINDGVFSKDNISVTIEFLEIIVRDALETVTGGKNYITLNRDYDLKVISEGFTAAGAAMALMSFVKARKMLSSNINSVTVAETILFDILEAKYKWQ